MKNSQNAPGRNDRCPCGSGRKFKNCCLDQSLEQSAKRSNRSIRTIVIAGAVGIIAIALMFFYEFGAGKEPDAPEGGNTRAPSPAVPTPAAWEYDAAKNRHWHPDHGHWHDGPPPLLGSGAVQTPATVATPAPWEYDAASDRHWHPDHGHWHDGPPPGNST